MDELLVVLLGGIHVADGRFRSVACNRPSRPIKAIGKFPAALFVMFPVISFRIPFFVEDLRY